MQRGEIWFAATPGGDRPVLVLTRDPVADRIGAVVVAALTEEGHAYELYEVTGPRMLTLNELAGEISKAAIVLAPPALARAMAARPIGPAPTMNAVS